MFRFAHALKRTQSIALALIIIFWQLSLPLAVLLANTSTVNAAPVCVNDTAGANDEPGQKDLTKLCQESAPPAGTEIVNWNWDDLGTSGNNTMDACALFDDADADVFIDYSICVITGGTPATKQDVVIYSCGNDKIDRCTSPINEIAEPYATTCTVTQLNTDPFPAGDFYPNDTVASCNFVLADLGVQNLSELTLTDVCSYPSQQPNSDPSDCVIIINEPVALIELRKNVVPDGAGGLFNLIIDGPGNNDTTTVNDQGDGGTTGVVSVTPPKNGSANATVSETAGTGTNLANYSSSVSCVNRNGGQVVASGSGTSLQVPVSDGSNIICTITNTAFGSITIAKNAIPDSTQNFGFTSNATGFETFQLDDEAGANTDSVPESITIPNLSAGTYTFTEAQVAGWYLDQIDCPNISETQDVASGTVSLTITAGQNVTCTFTNRQLGQIVVTKQTDPNNDPTQFSIAASPSNGVVGNANQSISDNQSVTYTVKHGTYGVTETVPAGWTETSNNCSGLVIDGNTPLVNGIPTRSCTIFNTKLAIIQIIKNALPNHAQDFSFLTNTLPGGNFLLDDDSGATGADNVLDSQKTFANLPPNVAYSVTEDTLPGWQMTGLTCDTGNFSVLGSMVTITPTAGQTIVCTYSNTKLGSISGTKFNVDADATDGTDGTPLSGWTIFIDSNNNGLLDPGELFDVTDGNGSFSFLDLLPGTYNLEEILQSGWTQIFEPADVQLDAGEESTGNDFGNFQNGSINGFKWNDLNGNGQYNDEPKLDGWTITLYNDNNDQDSDLNNQVAQTITAGGGNYSFTNLVPGIYAVCETPQAGWVQTYPSNPDCHIIVINESGETNQANFGNQGRGTITVVKNVDSNGDGQVDQTNVTDWTWDINGSGNFATGSGNSQAVAAGNYSVSEDQKADYHVTASSCTGETPPQAPSEQLDVTVAPGENVVCTFTNTRDTGTITVNKVLLPNDDPGKFNLQINGSTAGTGANVGHGGTTGAVQVVTGDYTIGETAGTGTSLANYSTQYECLNGRTVVASGFTTTSTTFDVDSDDSIVCTITNTRFAKIIVEKQTDPDGSLTPFTFNASYDGDGFSLIDGQQNNSGNLLPGNYSVSENTPLGWDLTGVTCSDQSDPSNISLQPGETVTCVFNNTQDANIVVVKQTNPDGSQQSFDFNASYDNDGFSLSDGQSNNSGDLDPGTYSVSENVPAGWDLETATCSDGSAPGSIALEAGETITCTFTNEQDANIVVVKQTDPDGSQEVFNFTSSYDNDGFTLTDGQSNDSGDLDPGTYSVSETVPGGWELKNVTCDDGSTSDSIDLSAGETVTCTFTNEQDANIIIEKETTPDGDPQVFSFDASYDEDGFSLSDGQSNDSGDLDPGTYSVSENLEGLDNWDLASVSCSDRSDPSAIELSAGETVTCTFNNEKRSTVTVLKYNDRNQNGTQDDGEESLPGWEIVLDNTGDESPAITQTTNVLGVTTFVNQIKGSYSLSEIQQDGWNFSDIDCEGFEGGLDGETFFMELTAGVDVSCAIGNFPDAALNITKSNDQPTPTTTGDTVTYTLVVSVPNDKGAVFDTNVLDLPPENFEYVPGSWTANSSVRGNIKSSGTTTEPTYASPGSWILGDMVPGEIVTLTYDARIGSSVITGTYPDTAFAQGCADPADCPATALFANVSTGANTPFVGTQVSIVTPAVLGASTTRLVNTGTNDVWRSMLIAGFIILVTLATFRASRPQKGGL